MDHIENANPSFSYSQKIWQFVLLYIFTFGFYFFYWFYHNNKLLYSYNKITIRPWLRTLGLIVPILNLYLIWNFFNDIKKFADKANVPSYPSPLLLTAAFVLCCALFNLPNVYTFLGFVSVIPLILVQTTLNRYWRKEQTNLPEKIKLFPIEWIICCLGGALLILSFIGSLIPQSILQ